MNVTALKVITNETQESEQRKPFSFDITQTDQRGMVLIDACVPVALATAFLRMLIACEAD